MKCGATGNSKILNQSRKDLNVLFVSIAGPPKGSPESLQVSKILKFLVKHPLNICLVTEELPIRNFGWRTIEQKYEPVLGKLSQIINLPVYYNRYFYALISRISSLILPRLDNEFLFTKAAAKVVRLVKQKPDIIYSRSTPFSSSVLALKLKRKYQIPWVMHLSDPWSISPFMKSKGPKFKYHQKMERNCFQEADIITLTSHQQIEIYKNTYPEYHSKFQWSPNVYDDDEVVVDKPSQSREMSFLHTGNFYGPGRSPEPILKAVAEIAKDYRSILDEVSFLFTGHQEPSIDRLINSYYQFGARHLGVLSLKGVYEMQRKSSVLILIDWNLPQHQAMFLLSKSLDYMAARKPVMAITTPGSTMHNLIQGVYGECFAHNDLEGIKRFLISIIKRYKKKDELFENPYEVNEDYAASINAKRLFHVLERYAGNGPNGNAG